jgi:uroporphyrinogen-III synthase
LLRSRGHEVLLAPLLQIEPIADADLGVGPWAAVLFTSANAIRAIAAHRRFSELVDLPSYVVGHRTQAAAVAAGFASIMSAEGDVNDLARLIASKPPVADLALIGAKERPNRANFSPPGLGVGVVRDGTALPQPSDPSPQPSPTRGEGVLAALPKLTPPPVNLPLLYCAGEERAGDLAGALQLQGLRVETASVYRSVMATELTSDTRAALAAGTIDAVLHYSARTAAAFMAAVTTAGVRDLSIQIRHLCLSAQAAAPLEAADVKTVEVASEPNEQALLTCIGRA